MSCTSLSLPKIGQLFGNRDHTTVMYANKKISELMKERRSIYNQVTEITAQHQARNRPLIAHAARASYAARSA